MSLKRVSSREPEPRDFFEEHKRLKQETTGSNPPPPSQAEARTHMSSHQLSQPQLTTDFVTLTSNLRNLGYDTTPLESLKEFAKVLDSEERKLAAEIEERQRRLEAIRQARELLKRLGV
ncbi:MAG: hypothetical protein NZ954_00350 [Thermofilaceae archaeon]|nr:hypothetical protein [Thermofilaceae archaeon]MCX8180370.1 hypothetical protein [Thermofilaceae archaeon]MDW8003905.1 hypothetical protein [Thermofilaceae archaeon]